MKILKKCRALLGALALALAFSACASPQSLPDGSTLMYASGDYTRINPAMDEHGEINLLLFSGLTSHDGENQVAPGLAESWDLTKLLVHTPSICGRASNGTTASLLRQKT